MAGDEAALDKKSEKRRGADWMGGQVAHRGCPVSVLGNFQDLTGSLDPQNHLINVVLSHS